MLKRKLIILFLSLSLATVSFAAEQTQAQSTINQVQSEKMININTASAAQLESLPHVGQKIAQRIIAYRKQHGNFASLADLASVRGISAARVKQMNGLAVAN